MDEWIEEYRRTDDYNQKYNLLREEATRLRGGSHDSGTKDVFNPDDVATSLGEFSTRVDGHLIAFVANDFGLPVALRPESLPIQSQDEIRQAILEGKYDQQEDLNEIRTDLLEKFPAIHKAIIVEYSEHDIRYHLPEGSNESTNFLTVREMVGLIDYTTNSFQSDNLSKTYSK